MNNRPANISGSRPGAITVDPLSPERDGWEGEVDLIPRTNGINLFNAVSATEVLIFNHKPNDVFHDRKETDSSLPAVSSPIVCSEDSEGALQSYSGPVIHEEAGHEVKAKERIVSPKNAMQTSPAAFPKPVPFQAVKSASEIDALLTRAKSIGIKVDDRRRLSGGGVYAALYERRDDATR